ncbi:MAG: FtsH protease activity modulator HflK [Alphaproteobacteria bacterium]|nr:FtsH protease activity modulator HflK [Alphaproteobacteria bacterium]
MSPNNGNGDGPWGRTPSNRNDNDDDNRKDKDGKSPWDRRDGESEGEDKKIKPSFRRGDSDKGSLKDEDRRKKKHSNDYDDLDEIFKQSKDKFNKIFGAGSGSKTKFGGSGNGDKSGNFIVWALLSFMALAWFSTGFYKVLPPEQGVVLRLGKFKDLTQPGLHYHLPSPIEKVYKVNVDAVRKEDFGFRKGGASISKRKVFPNSSLGNTNSIAGIVSANNGSVEEESIMLTGDENIVDIEFTVQWIIKDAANYLFNMKDPAGTVRIAAESSMREVIGQTPIQEVLADDKKEIQIKVQKVLQESLDNFGSGIRIKVVQLQKVDPPEEVIEAFNDVQNAKADKKRIQNEAEAYSNDILPKARGLATRKKQEAEAYKANVVNKAKGEADRFLAVYSEYKGAKDVTAKRLYIEAMEEVLGGTEKVIIDNKGGAGVLPYLPLKSLNGGAK